MIDGVRYAVIPDPERFSEIKVMYATSTPQDSWGVFACLKGTSWGAQIFSVTGEALSHALHGRPKPLRAQLKYPPRVRALRIPQQERFCLSYGPMCGLSSPHCTPGSGKIPECYEAPTQDRQLRHVATAVANAWDEGRYVFVVEGPEFIIT
jgi:hypothetical protein